MTLSYIPDYVSIVIDMEIKIKGDWGFLLSSYVFQDKCLEINGTCGNM